MLLKGKPVADRMVEALQKNCAESLCLGVFHPEGDGAAESYLKGKQRWLEKVGFKLEVFNVAPTTPAEELRRRVEQANREPGIHGIMIELPIAGLNFGQVRDWIDPAKDLEGITTANQGHFFATGEERLVPCTALAAVRLLEFYEIPLKGADALIVGRSNIVGLPLYRLLLNRNASPMTAHRQTRDLAAHVARCRIVAVAAGARGLVKSSDAADGAAVVDVGINVVENGIVGDLEITAESEAERIDYTPVPGGVGVVTNAVMLENLVTCWRLQQGR